MRRARSPRILMILLGAANQMLHPKSEESKLQDGCRQVNVGREWVQTSDFSATLTHDAFARNPKPLPTSPQLRAARRKTLSILAMKLRLRARAELCWLAAVSRPDICVKPDRLAFPAYSLQGSDVNRINDLAKTIKAWE